MNSMERGLGFGTNQARGHYREATPAGTSDILSVMGTGADVLVMVAPAEGATAEVQYTISAYAHLAADTAMWQSWPEGAVSEVTSGALSSGITGIRVIATGGAVDWEVAA